MSPLIPNTLAALALVFSTTTQAQQIHKCRAPDGALVYQDQPCAGETLPLPPILPPPTSPYLPPAPAAQREPSAAPTQYIVTDTALPSLYRCTKENGERYVSADPSPAPRYVPAWAIGATSTASNLPRSEARIAWDRSVGGAWVLVQDRCRPMPRGELCLYWKERLDETRRAVQRSFFDERKALEQETAGLRELLRTQCGR